MDPISAYEQIQIHIRKLDRKKYTDKPIPILFIYPYTLNELKKQSINVIFEHFHQKTGKDIVFFLFGYTKYNIYKRIPSSHKRMRSSQFSVSSDKESIFSYNDVLTNDSYVLYYSVRDFERFIQYIEKITDRKFANPLHTQLFFPTYLFDQDEFNFNMFYAHHYDLTILFEQYYNNSHNIFLTIRNIADLLDKVYEKLYDCYFKNLALDDFYASVDEILSNNY